MSLPTLFYAWQADQSAELSRDPIKIAAEAAIGSTAVFQEAIRLDHDSLGHAGTPPIAETIFRKIERADFFLADVTIIQKLTSNSGDKKGLPNANVLIELGYAAAKLGWDRIILVMNEHCGNASRLPFDLKHRRFPIRFCAATAEEVASQLPVLTNEIGNAIALCSLFANEDIERTVRQLSSQTRLLMAKHKNEVFYENNQSEGGLFGRVDHAIGQLLENELVVCDVIKTEGKLAYFWTHKGKQCLARLGLISQAADLASKPVFDGVIADLQMYEVFDDQVSANGGSSNAGGAR